MPVPNNPDWFKKYGKDWKADSPLLPEVTNSQFAANDKRFKDACDLAGVKPTKAQARKFKNKKGQAYAAHQEASRGIVV